MNTRAEYWNRIAQPSTPAARQHLWRHHSDAVNCAWLVSRLAGAPAARLLKTDLFDEAVADGLYPALSSCAETVVGIDVAASTAGAARARYARLNSVGADVRALPFADQSFDTIVSISTLDHFAAAVDIDSALRELYRVLRPSGRLLLTLDNHANPIVALRNALPSRALPMLRLIPYEMGATLDAQQLERSLTRAGFDLLEVETILHCPRAPAVAGAALLQRFGSPGAQQRYRRWLTAFEQLARWRTRFRTGYYIAAVARRRPL